MDEKEPVSSTALDITIVAIVLLIGLSFLGIYIQSLVGWYQAFLEWFYAKDWIGINRTLLIIFSVFNAIILGFIFFALSRYIKLIWMPPQKEAAAHTVTPKEEIRKSWEEIRALAHSPNSSDWNMAVLRADALLDDILQHLGYEGTTLAERLKIVDPTKLLSLDRVWSAHRLRNMIAHDPLQEHTKETIIETLRSYAQAFRELGMLEEQEQPQPETPPAPAI